MDNLRKRLFGRMLNALGTKVLLRGFAWELNRAFVQYGGRFWSNAIMCFTELSFETFCYI